jgi:hypothetical protein
MSRNWFCSNHDAVEQSDGSYINPTGYIIWYEPNGEEHRVDGPAVTYPDGNTYWYLHGTRYPFDEWLKQTPITDEQKLLVRLQYA